MSHNRTELGNYYNDHVFLPRGYYPNFFNENFFEGNNDSDFWNGSSFGGHNYGNYGGFGGFSTDLREKKDAYIIEAELPGIDKKNINIDVDNNVLTISAKYDEDSSQKNGDTRYIRRERRVGFFRRSFTLDNMKEEGIKAEINNGVLLIRCPKKADSHPNSHHIQIQ